MELFKQADRALKCLLCPTGCTLTPGSSGHCGVRYSDGTKITNRLLGVISSASLDSIEKKPLYHFLPGSGVYSVGFYGCTLRCGFCQNYSISTVTPQSPQRQISPVDFVEMILSTKYRSVAFTYSEPTLYFEWVLETASLLRRSNINTVLVTNGYLNPEPAEILLSVIDAVNVDLKGGDDHFYSSVCGGHIDPVKEFIRIAYSRCKIVEVTTLVIPGFNDDDRHMETIVDFIGSVSDQIPFHISRYHPAYKFNAPVTPDKTIDRWIEYSKKSLKYVYGGNCESSSNTYCYSCGNELVSRMAYRTTVLSDFKCKKCGTDNYGISS